MMWAEFRLIIFTKYLKVIRLGLSVGYVNFQFNVLFKAR